MKTRLVCAYLSYVSKLNLIKKDKNILNDFKMINIYGRHSILAMS